MCTQSLSCLKSKYLLFFSARQVSRHPGRDVSSCSFLALLYVSELRLLVFNEAIRSICLTVFRTRWTRSINSHSWARFPLLEGDRLPLVSEGGSQRVVCLGRRPLGG